MDVKEINKQAQATSDELVNWHSFQEMGDERGLLTIVESAMNIPFALKRLYYIYGTKPGVRRGFHAHKKLTQILICISGECKVLLKTPEQEQEVKMSRPDIGLVVEKMVWHEMFDFSSDCVLLVLASDYYNESDYIREYDEYVELSAKVDDK